MARPLRIQYPEAFNHITSRGNERKAIFRNDRDRKKFLSYLETAHVRYGAIIHVYCLMDNHYHLLVETPRGNLSQILHHINGAYTTYFNVKRQRCGHLFQGRYRAILVERDAYCMELSRYIHMNPLRAGLVKNLAAYPWSSYPHYVGLKEKPPWLETGCILGYFGQEERQAQKRYRNYVHEAIGVKITNPLEGVFASTFLGSEEFIDGVRQRTKNIKQEDLRNIPGLRALVARPSLDEIRKRVGDVVESEDLHFRKFCIYISHQFAGFSLREIGDFYNMKESAVSQTSRRFKELIMKETQYKKLLMQMMKGLNLSNVET